MRSNIYKLYAYSFFQCFLIVIPVIVPMWQAKGLSLQEIFLLQGIFGATLIAFDLPAGYLGDIWGRKKTLAIGSLVSALGFQVLWFGENFWHFVIYELILGVGLSLQSGCDVAILYGTLEIEQMEGRKAAFLGRRLTAQNIGEGIASLLGGFLAGFSLNLPGYATAISAWIPFLITLTLMEPQSVKLSRSSHLANINLIRKALFGHSRLLTLAILSFIFYGFATYCAVWSLQPYWKARGISVSFFGYLWAANSFMVAFVSQYAHKIEEKLGSVKTVCAIAVLPVSGYLGMGFTGGLLGLLWTLAFPICRGLNQVIFQDAINTRIPSEIRATANSVGSLGTRALFLVFGPILGAALDSQGPEYAMKILGAVYFFGIFLLAWPLLSERKSFQLN